MHGDELRRQAVKNALLIVAQRRADSLRGSVLATCRELHVMPVGYPLTSGDRSTSHLGDPAIWWI